MRTTCLNCKTYLNPFKKGFIGWWLFLQKWKLHIVTMSCSRSFQHYEWMIIVTNCIIFFKSIMQITMYWLAVISSALSFNRGFHGGKLWMFLVSCVSLCGACRCEKDVIAQGKSERGSRSDCKCLFKVG